MTVEQPVKKAVCKRCAEVIYFAVVKYNTTGQPLPREKWFEVARNVIDNDLHPCVNP